jgi:DnaK suppressor protein
MPRAAHTPRAAPRRFEESDVSKTPVQSAAAAGPSSPIETAAVATPPAASRFAERFAPSPQPVARTYPDPAMETLKPPVKADPKLANAWKSKSGSELTEEELLAMPDSEYMNEKQLDFFRTRLTALKEDLLSNAGETTEHLREDTSIVPDPADRATIEEEHALELRTRDRERKLLKKISQSLARIDAGDYGYCDETGEPIGLGRLLARPTATLSLEAQQRRELKQKMFGD